MKFDYTKVKQYKLYSMLKFIAVIVCKLRYKINYIGLENLPKEGGLIIACNHQNNFDPIVLGRASKRVVHFMAKEELFEKNAFGRFLLHLNAFPINRGAGDMTAIDFSEEIIKKGWVLGIFPEGTRSKDFKPGKGKSGVALIAKQTKADILPVAIYTDEEYKKGTRLTVRFGNVIKNEELGFSEGDYSAKELRAASKRIMGEITTLWEEGHCQK